MVSNEKDHISKSPVLITVLLLSVVLLSSCRTQPETADLGNIYNRMAQHHSPERNPIVVVPGIMGTKLLDRSSGKQVWGAFNGSSPDPENPEGARTLALPMERGKQLRKLTDEIRPGAVLEQLEVNLFGLPFGLKIYVNILRALGVGGYRDEDFGYMTEVDYGPSHFTCFQFGYDWRRELSESAQQLHKFLKMKRAYVRKEIKKRFGVKDPNVQFDLIAHSMGTLLVRYYLRYGPRSLPEDGSLPDVTWEGAEMVDRVVLIGPPNAGTVESLRTLVEGYNPSAFLPYYPPALLGTMPSLYELLPRNRHDPLVSADPNNNPLKGLFTRKRWEDLQWGLLNPDQDHVLKKLLPSVKNRERRRDIARNHLKKCLVKARQFTKSLDRKAEPPEHLKFYLFAGDTVPTPSSLSVDPDTGKLSVHKKVPGDGLVTRGSALMDERMTGNWKPRLVSPISWNRVQFLSSRHLSITMDPEFTDNLLYILLEDPRP